MKNMCKSRCPTYKSLLSKVCQKTCGYCNEGDNDKEEDNENNEDVEWKEIDGTKLVVSLGYFLTSIQRKNLFPKLLI
jgi:hypothetical protein